MRTPGKLGKTLCFSCKPLFDQNIEVSQQPYAKGKTNQDGGDRSVIILDGRITKKLMGEISAQECLKRGFVAWQIHQGDFRESKPVSQIWYVSESKPIVNPSWVSAHSM